MEEKQFIDYWDSSGTTSLSGAYSITSVSTNLSDYTEAMRIYHESQEIINRAKPIIKTYTAIHKKINHRGFKNYARQK